MLILPDKLKGLLTTLADTLAQLQEFPEQLDDWLLSNYSYIKTSSPELSSFLPKETIKSLNKAINDEECQEKKTEIVKMKIDGKMQDIVCEKLQSEKRTKEIFDRTEIIKGIGKSAGQGPKDPNAPEPPKSIAERTQYLKAINEQIKKEAKQGFIDQDHLASMIEMEGAATDGPTPEVAELQAAITGTDVISSAIPDAQTDDDEPIGMNVVAALAQRVGSGSKQSAQEKDLASLRKIHDKVLHGQAHMLSGEAVSKGGFTRSD
jgi:hypothetical protein